MPQELSFDIGFDASEFRKGIDKAAKDVDSFVRKTLGRRAGVVQGLSSFAGRAFSLASQVPGLQGGPIQQALSQRIFRGGVTGAGASIRGGTVLAGAAGFAAIGGAALAGREMGQASEQRATFVRQQASDAKRAFRPVGSMNFGAVTRQDVQDVALQDERFARARAEVRKAFAPQLQNFRGGLSRIAEFGGNVLSGKQRVSGIGPSALGFGSVAGGVQQSLDFMRGYNALISRAGLPVPTDREQRRMDEQKARETRALEAVAQANRDDALVWEIR